MDIEDVLDKLENAESIDEQIDVYDDFIDTIDAIDRLKVLRPILEEIADELIEGEISETEADVYQTVLADIDASPMNKTQMGATVSEFEKEARKNTAGNQVKMQLDDWLVKNIEKVVVARSTDSNVETTYIWEVKGSDNILETEEHHYSFSTLKKEIYKQFGVSTLEPELTDNDEWGNWIEGFISEREVEEEYTGTRTQVIEEIQRRVSESEAYTDFEMAFQRGRVYYDEEDDVYEIPSKLITSVCEDYGINNKALQTELKKKGWVGDGGVSENKTVNGINVRYWRLPSDFANANHVDPDETEFDTSRYEAGEEDEQ
ncbi:hypothetical protein [Natrinema versiforme]|uniref:Uncharacterized protein n=1 Tax=Natrinema versiforme TaxID=88724 RepID=A0A4V1G026_9EURY|nr:hypothetical protein [Natrinema versiforme]QCS43876.1 hypothetical protein FEJ81_16545 [Natrinema versiforme]